MSAVKEGWTYKNFEECLVKAPKAKQVQTTEYNSGTKYPIVSQEDKLVSGYCDDSSLLYHIDNPVVIFGDHTRVLKYVDFDFVVGADGVKILIPKEFLNAKFLFFYLQWYNIPSLGYSRHYKLLKEISIPIPPLPTQQSIVSELDKINELIAIKKSQLKDLDTLAQSIFYEMFALFEDNTATSNFILGLKGGKSLAGDEECQNKILKTGAVTYDYFKCDEVKNLPIDYIPLPENLLKDGDLLISRMNTLEYVGAVAYVWKAPNNTYIPDRLWRAKLNKYVNPIYLWFSLKQPKAKEQIRSLSSGTSGSMKNISIPRFLSVLIKNPPLSLQHQFAERVESIERMKQQVQTAIKDLETLLASRMQYWFD